MYDDYLRELKITHVRDTLAETGALKLIKGNADDIIGALGDIVDAYPKAKENRPEITDYCLTDFIHEIADAVTGSIVGSAYRRTRGHLANQYQSR